MEYGEGKTGCYRILIKGYQWIWATTRSFISFNHWNSKPEIYCSTTKIIRLVFEKPFSQSSKIIIFQVVVVEWVYSIPPLCQFLLNLEPQGGGDFHVKRSGMLFGNFELNSISRLMSVLLELHKTS